MNRSGILLIALMGAILVFAACSTATPTPTPTLTPKPTDQASITPLPPMTCRGPTLEIGVIGEALQFDQDRLEVTAGTEVVLCLSNGSSLSQHNWVLVQDGIKDDVAARGLEAGPDNDWVQPGDPDVVANTGVVKPGEGGEVSFTPPTAGTYQFVCTFPGHNITMYGDFIVTP